MLRLIQPHRSATGQRDRRDLPPALIVHGSTPHALRAQFCHGLCKVIAHQVEFRPLVASGGMECGLARWQGEDQPTMPRVHRVKAKHIAKKLAVGLRVLAVENKMRSIDHEYLPARRICLMPSQAASSRSLRRDGNTQANGHPPPPPPASTHTQSPAP